MEHMESSFCIICLGCSKEGLIAIHKAILSALDVVAVAAEASQQKLNERRAQWSYTNTVNDDGIIMMTSLL